MNYLFKNTVQLIVALLLFQNTVSQEDIPFQANEKIYVKGNSILIGNTILGKHKTKPLDSERVPNDAIDMKYIDIDDDETTFSSSAAEISIPENSSKIMYAGLYWSALYPGEKSIMRVGSQSIKYKIKGDRNIAIDSVKIKIDGQPYTNIKGEIVFDSNKEGPYENDAPYVCMANVTDYLNNATAANGMFTVANVNATLGKLEGGSAAGWLLYIVYEDNSQTSKYFTTYNGFTQVAKGEVRITFTDFQAKKQGDTSSKLLMAALEGDIKIKSDQCAILSEETKTYIPLFNEDRDAKNFFNSSITNTSEISAKRNPFSKNTLGFDLVKTNLPDGIIKNNATEATIKLKTRADRFYVFFTAFETEIEDEYLLTKNKDISTTPLVVENKKPITIVHHEQTEEPKKEIALQEVASVTLPEESQTVSLDTLQEKNALPIVTPNVATVVVNLEDEVRTITIAGIPSDFYLVTNVFSNTSLAKKWSDKLTQEGYSPQSFINPENTWTYVYIERDDSLLEITEKRDALRNKKGFEKAWIAKIQN